MQLIETSKEGAVGYVCERVAPKHIRALASKQAHDVITVLAKHPSGLSAARIAKELGVHEQNIYYHIRRLISAGVIVVDRTEDTQGALAKILRLRADAYALVVSTGGSSVIRNISPDSDDGFLRPFIENGKLNCAIVVGSPDPHGAQQARSRDAAYAIDLGIFIGEHLRLRAAPAVVLDTELHESDAAWKQNLIVIGGVVVNKAAARMNKYSPCQYDVERKMFVFGKKRYAQEHVGVIVKMPHPFSSGRFVLLVSGKRYMGTQAAILAITQHYETLCAGSRQKDGSSVFVVEGVDRDSDGIIDHVVFL